MGEFVCRVADANGRVFSHVEAAGTLAEARQKMVDRGLVRLLGGDAREPAGFLNRRTTRQVGGSDFLILNQQFNTLIKAGLPILRALDLLADACHYAEIAAGDYANPRSGTRRASRFPRRWTKRAFSQRCIRRRFWRAKRAETCQASWNITLRIRRSAPGYARRFWRRWFIRCC